MTRLLLPPMGVGSYDDSPIPRLTIHSFIMGVFVSMGGFIFGYDTGQVSGFLSAHLNVPIMMLSFG